MARRTVTPFQEHGLLVGDQLCELFEAVFEVDVFGSHIEV